MSKQRSLDLDSHRRGRHAHMGMAHSISATVVEDDFWKTAAASGKPSDMNRSASVVDKWNRMSFHNSHITVIAFRVPRPQDLPTKPQRLSARNYPVVKTSVLEALLVSMTNRHLSESMYLERRVKTGAKRAC